MTDLCRNGHDLSKHGKYVDTPAHPLHRVCMECRRITRSKEMQRRKDVRKKRARPAPTHCRNGHELSGNSFMTPEYPSSPSHRRCMTCFKANVAAARQRAKGRVSDLQFLVRGNPPKCVRGHPRSEFKKDEYGETRCGACMRERNRRDRERRAKMRAAGTYDVRCRNGHARDQHSVKTYSLQGQMYYRCLECAKDRYARMQARRRK